MSSLPDDITDRSIDNPHAAEVPLVTPGPGRRRSQRQPENLPEATVTYRRGRWAAVELDCVGCSTLVNQRKDDAYREYIADIRRALLEHGVSDESIRRASVGASLIWVRAVPRRAAASLCRRLQWLAECRLYSLQCSQGKDEAQQC